VPIGVAAETPAGDLNNANTSLLAKPLKTRKEYIYCIHVYRGGSSSGGKSGCLATGRLLVRSPGSASLLSVEVSLSKAPPNPNCSRRVWLLPCMVDTAVGG